MGDKVGGNENICWDDLRQKLACFVWLLAKEAVLTQKNLWREAKHYVLDVSFVVKLLIQLTIYFFIARLHANSGDCS